MKSKDTLLGLNAPKLMFLAPKEIKVVTKKALRKIADSIHDPEAGTYLNLCSGSLQNGPDPVCSTRTMHCGLGELYFVVTGRQPEEDMVDEDGVIDEVVNRSTIGDYKVAYDKKIERAKKRIEALDLPEMLKSNLLNQIEHTNYFEGEEEEEFRELLDRIPNENDQGEDVTRDFRRRAKRVAAILRKAAGLLPR